MRNIHLILPRKVAPVSSDGPDSSNKQDLLHVSSVICNGDDLGPFVCKGFASSHPETLLHHLRSFTHSHESEIDEVCRTHYQDFILTVDDLQSLLSDVDSLKSSLSGSNFILQSVARPLPRRR
ncbi:hypothetical protein MRB53_032998 [Persea americana]|uniref:Uncharacterized protein n=1 Tax=Persea americana TaxID=3435 RepID=A0ACC2KTN5_PERAE|nr:hypothetical protein MRB53_032998 [Persea americana]